MTISTLTTVISIRTRVIYIRRVWFIQAVCNFYTRIVWFPYTDCDFYTQVLISERKVWFQHAQVWFIHTGCDFNTQRDFETHKCDNVLTPVISTRTRVISTRRVQFLHVEFQHDACDFKTNHPKLTKDHPKIQFGFWLAARSHAFSHLCVWYSHSCVWFWHATC
jgi:hypothetical protein